MRERYPTRNGIAIPLQEIELPVSRYEHKPKKHNNHHNHWTSVRMGRLAVTQGLRDLDRHQYVIPSDTHSYIHNTFLPPALPTEEQAAREIIDAYESGECFKIYDYSCNQYVHHPIPKEFVDTLIAKYSTVRVFDITAD